VDGRPTTLVHCEPATPSPDLLTGPHAIGDAEVKGIRILGTDVSSPSSGT
jgi:hypothetical protein